MLRVATFNLENLSLQSTKRALGVDQRTKQLRRALERLRADVLCLQEVHAQNRKDHTEDKPSRELRALKRLLETTTYAKYHHVCTSLKAHTGVPRAERNLVILSKFQIPTYQQYHNDSIDTLMYRAVTEKLPVSDQDKARYTETVRWERPVLHAEIELGETTLHVLNLHLKSRLPTKIKGQVDEEKWWLWDSAAGWAEGYFLSSIKRVGQALETRVVVDEIFEDDPDAKIIVCGDFNAEPGEVPVEAICGHVENTGNPALSHTALIPCSKGIAESIRHTHFHHGKGNLLDHVLVSKALLAHLSSVGVHNEDLHDESLPFAFDKKYPESDHAPFVAIFDL